MPRGLDIGPATVKAYADVIARAKTILWNGPMGMFEDPRFAAGTNAVARAVADATQKNGAKSIIGGGDSVKALEQGQAGRQGDLHEHRRRRQPGISRRRGAAGRRGVVREINAF